jgi:hypothetical protein
MSGVKRPVAVSVTQMLDEMAPQRSRHVPSAEARHAEVVEVSAEQEQRWREATAHLALAGRDFNAPCTPGCLTSEGAVAKHPRSRANERYRTGAEKFITELHDQHDGTLESRALR